MTDNEYLETQAALERIASLVRYLPLEAFLEYIAETEAGQNDSIVYLVGRFHCEYLKRVALAAREMQKALVKIPQGGNT